MSEQLQSVTVYASFVEAIDGVCKTDAEKGKMYGAIMRYALFNEEPQLPALLTAVFNLMRPVIDKSKARKLSGKFGGAKRKANGKQNESKMKADADVCSIQNEDEEKKQNESDVDVYNNKYTSTSTSSSTSSSINNASTLLSDYPETVNDVLRIAEKAGCAISQEEAERYFVCRMSANWIDAAGRKIAVSRLGFDVKRWVLNAEKAENAKKPKTDGKKQREVKYEPEW